MGTGKLKCAKSLAPDGLPRKIRVAELAFLLDRYEKLSGDRDFARDCRNFDRLDASTDVGDRRTSEAAVELYLKWEVYPIPEFFVNDHNFRVWLEQIFLHKQRVIYIPVSPLTTKAEVLRDFRQIENDISRPRKIPDLKRLRVALLQKYLIDRSAFHAFKPSDFATAMGRNSKKGRVQRKTASGGEFTVKLTAKETNRADRITSMLVERGIPYPAAGKKATRQVIKKRWRESTITPKIRMATQRSMRTLKALLTNPNK